MKEFIVKNHWWLVSAILFIGAIVQTICYGIVYSGVYSGWFFTLTMAIPLFAFFGRNKWTTVLSIIVSALLAVLVFANRPQFTVKQAENELVSQNYSIAKQFTTDGIDETGQYKIYVMLVQKNGTGEYSAVYFNPKNGEYNFVKADNYMEMLNESNV